MGSKDRLKQARYAATCYLELHQGAYLDVFDQLRGIIDPGRDANLFAAAALYTPVINLQPREYKILRVYGRDIHDLLMETTYAPDLAPDERLVAMEARLPAMSPRGMILQFAALKAYFEPDLRAMAELAGDGEGDLHYCGWLEREAVRIAGLCPELYHRIGRMIAYHRRSRGAGGLAHPLGLPVWRQVMRGLFSAGS